MSDTFDSAIFYEGEEEAIKRVAGWLTKHWESSENEGGLTIEIYEYDSEDEDPFEEVEFDVTQTPAKLAKQVVEASTQYCDGLESGKARFKVKVEGVRGQVTFTITVPERELDDEVNEGPHEKGFSRQQMRHNERLVKQLAEVTNRSIGMFEKAAGMFRDMVSDKDKRIEKLEAGYIENIRAFEDITQAKHVRDLEMRRLENDERRKDQVAGTLMQFAPHLLSKFMGTTVPPQMSSLGTPPGVPSRTPIEMSLEGFLNTFTKDQLDSLVGSGIMKQEQIMGLIQLATMVRDRQEAEEAATKAKPPETETPKT